MARWFVPCFDQFSIDDARRIDSCPHGKQKRSGRSIEERIKKMLKKAEFQMNGNLCFFLPLMSFPEDESDHESDEQTNDDK